MEQLTLQSVAPLGADSRSFRMVSDSGLSLSLTLDSDAADLVERARAECLTETEEVMFAFMLATWKDTDCTPLFSELEYMAEPGLPGTKLVIYTRNELRQKFYRVDIPLPFALVLHVMNGLSVVTDETTAMRLGGKRLDKTTERTPRGQEAGD